MTTKQVQLRRGSDDDHDSFTGAIGELTYVSDTKELRIHDGSLAGGFRVVPDAVVNVKSYGATGDGVTDDTDAIQAALNAGRVIYFPQPSEHYVVSEMLHIGWNGTVITGSTAHDPGESNAEIHFMGTEDEYALFNFNNPGGTQINARTVVVNNLSIKLGSNVPGIHISAFDTGGGFSNSVFKNVSIYGTIDANGNRNHYGLRVRGLDLGDTVAAAGTPNNDQYHNNCYNCYFDSLKIAVYWDGAGDVSGSAANASLCNGGGLFECRFKDCALGVHVWGDACRLMNSTFNEPKRSTGTHTAADHATTLTDTSADFGDLVVGGTVKNTTDGSTATIVSNTATTITLSVLDGGDDDTWETGDAYIVMGSYLELYGGASRLHAYNNYFDASSTAGTTGIIIDEDFTPNGVFFQKNTLSRSAITDNATPKGYFWSGSAETEVNYLDVETRIELREIDGDLTALIPNDGGDPIRSFVYFDDDNKIKARIGSTTTILAETSPAAYTVTNDVVDRDFDADSTTVEELADVLGTLINDLQNRGIVG